MALVGVSVPSEVRCRDRNRLDVHENHQFWCADYCIDSIRVEFSRGNRR